ncbi:MFS transporter, NNP family, nitrate/nitrite transporter [Andreprevotia lacus DSM 23236]|jgi:NNP family nitrate/nitrite transporter-like MFS transporter|uniref:MFS transporter, NNP family, nitrate/nitrite transporter n=1 Tax=Andreprevotia lacus DSM 23236 TaxID=1121001 RepID=A0A1W1XWW7_9NEIS|nr:nitrate/nitrite transporter [Andreprevotia lacus]SMC28459.1 MFS transporter, NNP family, nitrate/nitrite transporter [Andreprevotia lacus DSM 23236]
MSKQASHIPPGAISVLVSSTFAFTICFAVWMMFAVLGIPIKTSLGLSETEFGLLAAMPVLTGSLVRVPLGIWTDRFGGRIVLFVLMLSTVAPIWLMSHATAYWHFLVLALFVGLAGGAFSVGTPYVARWFPRERQGLAMGIFGAGNSGSALTKFVAPALIVAAGGSWTIVPKVYAVAMLVTAILFWVGSRSKPEHLVSRSVTLREQLAMLRDPRVWRYCQYYSVVFGGYVALALWMTKYYIGEYGFDMKTAALLAACFSLPGGVLRALGGWISDRYGAYKTTWWVMWVCWVAFFLLSYPQTRFSILTVGGPQDFHIGLTALPFTLLLFVVGIAMAVGKASVFKFISNDFPDHIGAVSGMVGLAGGLGGFVLPILFGALLDLTGVRSSCFMLLYGTVCVSLVWMHFSFRAESVALGEQVLAQHAARPAQQ